MTPRVPARHASALACASAFALSLSCSGTAAAGDGKPDPLIRIERQLAEQAKLIADQDARLKAQQVKIEALEAERDANLAAVRATGVSSSILRLAPMDQPPNVVTELPARPVGEGPQTSPASEVTAIPAAMNVLTPRGRLVLDPSVEYVRTSTNRLVFRGVQIVAGFQVGLIEASDVARETAVATVAGRYGLTDRLELEARIPYVYRHDRFNLLAQASPDFESGEQNFSKGGIGDIEVAARYQLNSGRNGSPIFVANGRVKPPTGSDPYDVPFDESGVALGVATGSGFWSVEGGLTMIYPSEPAIIFGGLTYLHNFSRDINREIGERFVGRVEPGDSIGAQIGFGLSLNPRFSVSLGYSHNYIFPTKSEVGTTDQETRSLQVGSMLMGWSFRLSDRLTLNNSFEFGITEEAPDMRFVLRAPYRF